MAAIIQHGSMSAPSQGGLFQGKKFWLSRQVPDRNSFVKQINANGGKVVMSEKEADICIVDHLKDSTNEGMFSYKYIEKSVRNGKLENLESHQVVPTRKRTISKLRSRNAFTQEDDDILLYILSKTTLKLNGNKVYEEIAAKYRNHTAHSWRERWVKHWSKLMDTPRPFRQPNLLESSEQETQPEIEPEYVRSRKYRSQFTKEDDAILKKVAVEILDDPEDLAIYERLSKEHPQHTPKQWQRHFTRVMLPRIALEGLSGKTSPKSKDSFSGSEDEEPITSTDKNKVSPKIRQEARIEPGPSPPDLKHRKPQVPISTSSPIRTVSVRDPPRSRSKERSKRPMSHQPEKSATISPCYRPTSPMQRNNPKATSKTTTPKTQTSPQQTHKWGAETRKSLVVEDQDSEPIPASSPPRIQPNTAPNNQKRRRESLGFTPEQRKKNRKVYQMEEIMSTPEPESSIQSRALSPELGGNTQGSSPVTKNIEKQSYAEMSTQALYNQPDDGGSLAADMEFPELEITSASHSPAPRVASPPEPEPEPQPEPKGKSTPSKLPVVTSTPTSKPKSPLPPATKDDPDGLEQVSTFLVHCQKEYKTSERQVIYAIERTSGITALVEMVLQSMVDGKSLPVDVPGVWSEEEDKILMGQDSREMQRLANIKGDEQTQRRLEFLNLWNMA